MATINVSSLIKTAIRLCREHEDMTTEQILSEVMKKVPIQDISELVRPEAEPTKTKTKKSSSDAEKKPRAAPKPRAVPEDETRCCARSFYENLHLEGGVLKVMRDDPANLYGDRCKFKKSGETDFCKHHADKQTLGIWDGEYSGKFKIYVEKTESESEEKPKPASTKSVAAKKAESTPEELEEVEEEPVKPVAKPRRLPPIEEAEKKPSTKPEPVPAPKEEEDALSVEDIEIDGQNYLIDEDGNVYDAETQDAVGIYNKAKGKWIQKM